MRLFFPDKLHAEDNCALPDCHVLFLFPGPSLCRATPLWLRLERRTSQIWTTTSLRSSLSYFSGSTSIQDGYLDISWDAQANRQDLHGLHRQLVFIVSQHGPHTPEPDTARGPGRQLWLQGLRGRRAGLP